MHILPATTQAAFETAPRLALAADIAVGLACLSALGMLATLVLLRRDLFDARTGWFLGIFVLTAGTAYLIAPAAGGATIAADLSRLLLALLALSAAAALWSRVPRLLSLGNPLVLARELQDRRAAELRARQSEARVAQFLSHVPEALFMLRVTDSGAVQIEPLNAAFTRVFGTRAASEDAAGNAAGPRLPPALAAHVAGRWREVVVAGTPEECELTADLPGGRRSWQIALVPIRGPDRRVDCLLGSARDVTATRLLQDGLVQAARVATIGTMCEGLAHEASQPLNAATLWLRRMRQAGQALPEAERRSFQRAAELVAVQLHRAGDLLHHIRGLAVEEPRDAVCFDAAEPVAAALRNAATQYAADAITLALESGETRLPVLGSPHRLEQAVLQLLSNARDAVQERRLREPEAPARIAVALHRTPRLVAVEVRDSGCGVPAALAGRIFDPFFTTKEPGRGLGLGLSRAASIARGMGGCLTSWNLPGGGACFRLELATAELSTIRHPDAVALV
jgi:C4-dicarboxylate-specific signal transduction histidine kinase